MYWGSTWPQQPRGPPLFRKQLRVWFSSLFLLCLSFIHLLLDFLFLSISLLLLFFPLHPFSSVAFHYTYFFPFPSPWPSPLHFFAKFFNSYTFPSDLFLSPLVPALLLSPLTLFSPFILLSHSFVFFDSSLFLSLGLLSFSLSRSSLFLSLGLLSLPPSLSFDYPLSLPALSLSTLIIHSLYLLFLSYLSSFSPLLFPLFPPLYPCGLPPSPLSSCRPLCPGE